MVDYDTEAVLRYLAPGGNVTAKGEYEAICPLHGENTPSFGYNLGSDKFHCFGCHYGGYGLRQLVKDVLGLDDFKVTPFLRGFRLGAEGSPSLEHYRRLQAQREARASAIAEKELAMARQLWDGGYEAVYAGKVCTTWHEPYTLAQEYLINRKFHPLALEHFHVHTWEFTKSYPIYIPLSWNGRVFGYTRRAIYDRRDKYLTMSELDTSANLFGEAVQGEPFLLVEGPLDAIKAWQRGTLSVGAVMSNNFSDMQADIVAEWVGEAPVVCGSDMDNGGLRLYEQIVTKMAARGKRVVRMYFSGKDVAAINKLEYQLAWEAALEDAGIALAS